MNSADKGQTNRPNQSITSNDESSSKATRLSTDCMIFRSIQPFSQSQPLLDHSSYQQINQIPFTKTDRLIGRSIHRSFTRSG
jgi:hypothetical protein